MRRGVVCGGIGEMRSVSVDLDILCGLAKILIA